MTHKFDFKNRRKLKSDKRKKMLFKASLDW